MTVSTSTSRVAYNGDAVTLTFSVPFYFLANSDLKVYVGGVLMTLTTDYSVSGAGVTSGGSITFVSAPASGSGNVVIVRDPDQLQSTAYPTNDSFPSKSHEKALDKLTMLIQRLFDKFTRTLVFPDSDGTVISTTLPAVAARASLVLGFDALGQPAVYSPASAVTDSQNITEKRALTHAPSLNLHNWIKTRKLNVIEMGLKGDWNGSTGTDDSQGWKDILSDISSIWDGTGGSRELVLPAGYRSKISSVIEVPPGVVISGETVFGLTNAMPGSIVDVTHNGVGFRFVRRNASPGSLYHTGGLRSLAINGPGAGSSVHLVELGDSGAVNTSTGAWNGEISRCLFNNVQTGYGIYSANSQSWKIKNNIFKAVKYGVYYNTVVAEAAIDDNQFDNASLASGSAGCAIFARPGSLGGSVGFKVRGNYIANHDKGVHLCSIIGASLLGNTYEGIFDENIELTKYLLDEATVDGSGCSGANIAGESFINWNADGVGAKPAILLAYSPNNFIGRNTYQSPNGAAGAAIQVYDATTINNIIIAPIVTGANAGTIPPLQYNNAVLAKNTIIAADWYQFSDVGGPTTASWGAAEKGRMWMESNLLRIWAKGPTGADPQKVVIPCGGNRTSTNEGATVDVTGCFTVTIRNAGAQTVTGFTDNAVYPGKTVTFYADSDANTTFQGATLGTRGGTNYLLAQFSSITFQYQSAGIGWSEQSRKAA